MMKTYVLVFAMLLTSTFTFAQGGREAYSQGDKTLQFGVGLGRTGGYYNSGFSYGFGVPLSAALEFGASKYFSVGPYAAFASYSSRFNQRDNFRYSIFSVGAKGSFHYLSLINGPLELGIDESKLDLYISIYLGLAFDKYNISYFNDYNRSYLDFGTVIGGRYMINEQLGAFTEIGYGALAVWTLGLSYRF